MSDEISAIAPRRDTGFRTTRRVSILVVTVIAAAALGFGANILKHGLAERSILTRALITAVQNQDEPQVVRLLEQGADPDARFGGELPQSLLQQAAILLRIRKPAYIGDPLIVEAAFRPNSNSILKALLQHGADPHAAGNNGIRALHWAAFNRDTEIARLLIDAGAEINAQDQAGVTALHHAASRSFVNVTSGLKVMELLLQRRADPNATSHTGMTPLMAAAESGDPQAVRLLLDHHADPRRRDRKGLTALDHASATATKAAGKDVASVMRLLRARS
jgi:uncharacterized protein